MKHINTFLTSNMEDINTFLTSGNTLRTAAFLAGFTNCVTIPDMIQYPLTSTVLGSVHGMIYGALSGIVWNILPENLRFILPACLIGSVLYNLNCKRTGVNHIIKKKGKELYEKTGINKFIDNDKVVDITNEPTNDRVTNFEKDEANDYVQSEDAALEVDDSENED